MRSLLVGNGVHYFLAELYYVTFGLWHEHPSIVLLHPRQTLELFGNIFAPPNSSGTRTVCIKNLDDNSKGFRGIVQSKYKGV